MIAICALISGADSWTQVAEYGRSKLDWFKVFHHQRYRLAPGKTRLAGD